MKNKIKSNSKNIVIFLLTFTVLLSLFTIFSTASVEYPDTSECTAYLLYSVNRDEIVMSENIDRTVPMGSMAKLLTGYLSCVAFSERLEETVILTEEMLEDATGYRLKLGVGERITIGDLLASAVCGSYNDAYYVLGSLLAGDSDFLSVSQEECEKLGLTHTILTNSSGYPEGAVSTVSDLLHLCRLCSKNELFMSLCSAENVALDYGDTTIYNRNGMVSNYFTTAYYNRYVKGLCEGETDGAGSCVCAYAEKDGEVYICIVMGGTVSGSIKYGVRVANRMLDWVYKTYTDVLIEEGGTYMTDISVNLSDLTGAVEVVLKEDLYAFVPKTAEIGEELTTSIRLYEDSIDAPFEEGTAVGYLAVFYQGKLIAKGTLVTSSGAEKGAFTSLMSFFRHWFDDRGRTAGTVAFVLLMGGWIFLAVMKKRSFNDRLKNYEEHNAKLR